jgi:predicted transcriptional regulator YdeE
MEEKMKLLKKLAQPILKSVIRKNVVTRPEVIDLDEKKCIGYMISTSFEGNQKKKDIPPFYHDVYDNDRLGVLKKDGDPDMYCIFDFHSNGKDLDYYIAVENRNGRHSDDDAEITLPKGKYVRMEFLKRNHTAASMIALYIRKLWIELNGYAPRNTPVFILYDERFHRNYRKYGCREGDYLGDPVATLHVPLK